MTVSERLSRSWQRLVQAACCGAGRFDGGESPMRRSFLAACWLVL